MVAVLLSHAWLFASTGRSCGLKALVLAALHRIGFDRCVGDLHLDPRCFSCSSNLCQPCAAKVCSAKGTLFLRCLLVGSCG